VRRVRRVTPRVTSSLQFHLERRNDYAIGADDDHPEDHADPGLLGPTRGHWCFGHTGLHSKHWFTGPGGLEHGLLTTSGALPFGTYSASGTTSDSSGDVGFFTFAMTVGPITQNKLTTGSVVTTSSSTFTAQLSVSRNTGAVTFTQSTGAPSLVVSTSGVVSTSSATLAPGTYKVTGTTTDTDGDQGRSSSP